MRDSIDIKEIRWANALSDDFKGKLANIAQHKTIAQTEHAALQGLASAGVIYFVRGTAVVTMQTPNLKTINNMVFGQRDWFGDYQPQQNSAVSFKVAVLGSIDIIIFDNNKLRHLMEQELETYSWFYYISSNSRPKWLQSQLLGRENKHIRIIYILLELAVHQVKNEGNIKLSISQQALSEMVGITRQRVNEVLIKLQSQGYLSLGRNCINLLNIKGLSSTLNGVDLGIRDPRTALLGD